MSCTSLIFRRPIPEDHQRLMAVLPSWTDGRDLRPELPRAFFEQARSTSLLVEHEDTPLGLLVGSLPADHAGEARIVFLGVAPEWRRVGLASDLCRRFFALARADGRSQVRAVGPQPDSAALRFLAALGFSQLPGAAAGEVRFERSLDSEAGTSSSQPRAPEAGA